MAGRSEDLDQRVRAAAFAHLEMLTRSHGDVLPSSVLRQGFPFEAERVHFIGPQGIFKPALLDVPLSILTVAPTPGRPRPYEDEMTAEGFIRYRYRGTDPWHVDNVGLRAAKERVTPLIYFHGVVTGMYFVTWPVYVVDDDPLSLTFVLGADEAGAVATGESAGLVDYERRRYVTRVIQQRLHQASFRQRVLDAYRRTCAMCRLHHAELLDAAHILPDGHPRGQPVVPNGLALCKLHHAAFDANIVGVRPDLVVDVRHDVLAEIDGPMLRHGLQEMQGQKLVVPSRAELKPSSVLLAERYELFRQAG